jgi:hypothetical protein
VSSEDLPAQPSMRSATSWDTLFDGELARTRGVFLEEQPAVEVRHVLSVRKALLGWRWWEVFPWVLAAGRWLLSVLFVDFQFGP